MVLSRCFSKVWVAERPTEQRSAKPTDQSTGQPTDGRALLKRCEDASKNSFCITCDNHLIYREKCFFFCKKRKAERKKTRERERKRKRKEEKKKRIDNFAN